MVAAIKTIKNKERPPLHRYWMVTPDWQGTLKTGDCSMADNTTKSMFDKCIFTQPWLPDSADLFDEEGLGLVNNLKARMTGVILQAAIITLIVIVVTIVNVVLFMNLFSTSM